MKGEITLSEETIHQSPVDGERKKLLSPVDTTLDLIDRALLGAAQAYTEHISTIFPPTEATLPARQSALREDDERWYMRPDRQEKVVVPPKRLISLGGLDVTVSPADAPIALAKGPDGVTATVGNMPPSENIIVPYLRITQQPQAQSSPVILEGAGKAVVIIGSGVQAVADRPGRTLGNTVLHPMPGANVTRPKPQAA